jgi:hypothetical protein
VRALTTLPNSLWLSWACLAPGGLAFAVRIAWEKTFLTWAQGPQAVGFALMHLAPTMALFGFACSLGLMLWPWLAGAYCIVKRARPRGLDVAMTAICLFVIAAIVTPDHAFVR